MAIYHLTAQIIGRADARSSIAAAAYRSGETLVDEVTGDIHKPNRVDRVAHTEILAPADAPEWAGDRGRLWNSVEARDTRKNSQLSREFEVSLPRVLSADQRLELVRGWIRDEFTENGVVADLAVHTDAKNHNPHCHIMTTLRPLGPKGWGDKMRAWNDRKKLEAWRKSWAEHTNRALERASRAERVDHRSLEDQGIEREPTIKEGYAARQMEARGQVSRRMSINRQIRAWNRQLRERTTAAVQASKAGLETMAKKIRPTRASSDPTGLLDQARQAATSKAASPLMKQATSLANGKPVAAVQARGPAKPPPAAAAAPKAPPPKKPPTVEDDVGDLATQQAWLSGQGSKGR